MGIGVQGALDAGYNPTDVVNYLASNPDAASGFDIAGARKAGYSDEEIAQALTQSQSPAQPPPPPSSSLASAFTSGLTNALPASLEGGAAGIARSLGFSGAASDLDAHAQANRQADAAAYQPDPNAGVLSRFAGSVAHGLPSAIPALASAAAIPFTGGASAPISAALLAGGAGLGGLQAIDSVRQEKKNQGLDDQTLTPADYGNAALQTAINSAPVPGLRGLGMIARPLADAALQGGRAAVSDLANIGITSAQGGTPEDFGQIANRLGSDFATGAATGALLDTARATGNLVGSGASVIGNAIKAGNAPDTVKDFAQAAASHPYTQAFQQAQQANPTATPDQIDAQLSQQGIAKPTLSDFNPSAQQGLVMVAAKQAFTAEQQAVANSPSNVDPSAVSAGNIWKNVKSQGQSYLQNIADNILDSGQLTKDQAAPLYDVIAQAAKHNAVVGQGGGAAGGFETYADLVNQLPLPQALKDNFSTMVGIVDIASKQGLEKNSRGFFEQAARVGQFGLPIGGAITAALSGLPGSHLAGYAAGEALKGRAIMAGRALDQALGNGLPQMNKDFANIDALQQGNPALANYSLPTAMATLARMSQGGLPGTPSAPPMPPGSSPPAQPSTPSPTPTPPPASIAQAAAVMAQQRAQAQAQQAAQQAALVKGTQNLPYQTQGWQAGIAQLLGMTPASVRQGLQGAVDQGHMTQQTLDAHNALREIPNDSLHAFTSYLRDNAPQSTPDSGSSAPVAAATMAGSGVRNPMAYQANLNQEASIADNIVQSHPELADYVNQIRDGVRNNKSSLGRTAVLSNILGSISDPMRRQDVASILQPLTAFGQQP